MLQTLLDIKKANSLERQVSTHTFDPTMSATTGTAPAGPQAAARRPEDESTGSQIWGFLQKALMVYAASQLRGSHHIQIETSAQQYHFF
jgi:hypothetical protein